MQIKKECSIFSQSCEHQSNEFISVKTICAKHQVYSKHITVQKYNMLSRVCFITAKGVTDR